MKEDKICGDCWGWSSFSVQLSPNIEIGVCQKKGSDHEGHLLLENHIAPPCFIRNNDIDIKEKEIEKRERKLQKRIEELEKEREEGQHWGPSHFIMAENKRLLDKIGKLILAGDAVVKLLEEKPLTGYTFNPDTCKFDREATMEVTNWWKAREG